MAQKGKLNPVCSRVKVGGIVRWHREECIPMIREEIKEKKKEHDVHEPLPKSAVRR